MRVFFILIFLFLSEAHAVQCEWWQSKVSAHMVGQHERQGNQVSAHGRKEHCRERWNKANFFIRTLKDKPETGVEFTESIKIWKKQKSEEVLKILAAIPEVYEMENYHYYRSEKSDPRGNPATIYTLTRSMILFDTFFYASNKDQILVHESGHYLYEKLSTQDKLEFMAASGWTKSIVNRSEKYIPPKNLIKEDSSVSQDEDYANHLELYLNDKATLRTRNLKVYELFEKRFKK